MTDQDIEARRKRDLERYYRQTAERRAQGLCIKCGKRPPTPHRTWCEPCAAKKRPADRARHHRRTAERVDRGLCPKCGKVPPAPGRSQCEPCLEKDRVAGRATAGAKAGSNLSTTLTVPLGTIIAPQTVTNSSNHFALSFHEPPKAVRNRTQPSPPTPASWASVI